MDSPMVRQIFVALSPLLNGFSMGGSIAFPSFLLQQFKSNESTIQPDLDTLTWITSMHGIASMGGLMMPSLMQRIGRKRSFIVSCILLIIGWCLAFTAKSADTLILSESFLGFGCSCSVVVNLMAVSEMLAPKYRTLSMMSLGLTQSSGMIFSTLIGTFIHWKTLALIMGCPVVIAFTMVILWPESPPWLAYKGNFVECEKAFKWLRGTDDASLKELQELISAHRESGKSVSKMLILKEIKNKFTRRDFIIPSLFMFLLFMNTYMSGGICLYIYGKYVMEIATGDDNASTIGFLLFNATIVIGATMALTVIKYFNCKTVLFVASFRLLFLLSGSLILYLQKIEAMSKNPWIFIFCYEVYMTLFSSGLHSITFTLAIELMPVKHRGVGGALYNIFTGSLHFATNKLLPYIIIWLDVSGTFLMFAMVGVICHLLIWKFIPETKNRTLQEIEDYYKYGKYDVRRNLNDLDVHTPINSNVIDK